jgi:hypothetical protein
MEKQLIILRLVEKVEIVIRKDYQTISHVITKCESMIAGYNLKETVMGILRDIFRKTPLVISPSHRQNDCTCFRNNLLQPLYLDFNNSYALYYILENSYVII